jgi:acetyl-CoA acetyltransferase
MGRKVNVIGVGMTKFQKPGASDDYNVMAASAIRAALLDSKADFKDVEQAFAGYVYGDSTCGQRAVYEVGLSGIPVINVNNNCSTGSTALFLGRQAIEGGLAECVLVVGFEKMEKGALANKFNDRTNPLDQHAGVMSKVQGFNQAPPAAQMLEVRHQARDLRQGEREGAQTRREQSTRALQPSALARRNHGLRRGVRPTHPLPMLPAHVRSRRGHSV